MSVRHQHCVVITHGKLVLFTRDPTHARYVLTYIDGLIVQAESIATGHITTAINDGIGLCCALLGAGQSDKSLQSSFISSLYERW